MQMQNNNFYNHIMCYQRVTKCQTLQYIISEYVYNHKCLILFMTLRKALVSIFTMAESSNLSCSAESDNFFPLWVCELFQSPAMTLAFLNYLFQLRLRCYRIALSP